MTPQKVSDQSPVEIMSNGGESLDALHGSVVRLQNALLAWMEDVSITRRVLKMIAPEPPKDRANGNP